MLQLQLFDAISVKYKTWKEKRFLKKHSCETWSQYNRRYDPDYQPRADRVKDYYHGYQHIVQFTTARGDPWTRFGTWLEGLEAIHKWCDDNCEDKWRHDILRVIEVKDFFREEYEWVVNEIGGGDVLFFAFKNDHDAFLFKLTWGSS